MKVKLSPLKILDFFVIKSSFDFDPPEPEVNVQELFSSYEIDFDFARTANNNFYQVYVKASINREQNKSLGYQIFAEGCVVFDLDEKGLSPEEKWNYLNYTSLVIAINHLRSYISSITRHSPMGKYLLPSIDIKNLIEQKTNKTNEAIIESNRQKIKEAKAKEKK